MDSNENIIQIIDDAIMIEERVVPFVADKINDEIFLSSFTEEQKNEIIDILTTIKRDSLRHKKLMEKVKKKVEKHVC